MKRPLLPFSICMMLGVLAGSVQYSAGRVFVILVASVMICSALAYIFFRHRSFAGVYAVSAAFFILGASEYCYFDYSISKAFMPYQGEWATVRGYMDSEAEFKDDKVSFVVTTSDISVRGALQKVEGKLLVTTLKKEAEILYAYGAEVKLEGQINLPKGVRNPGGFDYKRYLAKSGISATVFADPDNIRTGSGNKGSWLVKTGIFIKNRIVEVINKSLPEQQAGLLNGMIIGYRDGLDDEVQACFSDAGLTHIMAVSGANVAFIVAPLVFLFKRLKFSEKRANAIIILILALFLFVAGFSPSVARAVVMADIILIGGILRREADVINSMCFAAMLLMLNNPYTLFDIGFQLSFAATLSIILLYRHIKAKIDSEKMPGLVSDTLAVSLAAQLGVLPITAYYFNKVSLVSILSNLFVVPLTGVISVLGFIMAILGQFSIMISKLIGYVNCSLLTLVLIITKYSAAMPFSVLKVVTPPLWLVFAYYMLILFYIRRSSGYAVKLKAEYIYAASMAAAVIIGTYLVIPQSLEVVFLDVGEGDSAFIRTSKGKNVLIDGGGFLNVMNREKSHGENTVIPFLLDSGVKSLDAVIATHGHDDHIQGLKAVMAELKVKTLILPSGAADKGMGEIAELARRKDVDVVFCSRGDNIFLDSETYFETIFPVSGLKMDNYTLNNGSLVLKLNYGNTSVMFTGDIEEEVETALVDSGADLRADVLKVAHHGSANSTGDCFLRAVNPVSAIISVGKNNFGHPSSKVLEKLNYLKINTYRTDLHGGIMLTSDKNRISIGKTVEK